MISFAAYLEAIFSEIIGDLLPSLDDLAPASKLKVLRAFPIIEDAAFQAASLLIKMRNKFARSPEILSLSSPDVNPAFRTFVGIMKHKFMLDYAVQSLGSRVDELLLETGFPNVKLDGFSSEDDRQLKCGAFFLCIHFSLVGYSLPAKGKPLEIHSDSHEIHFG